MLKFLYRSTDCLGQAIGELATRPPESIKDKLFHTYDYNPTGDEIVQTFAMLHGGKSPKIVEYTHEAYEMDVSSPPPSLKVGSGVYKHTWGSGEWNWEGERLGPREKNFEELAKFYWSKR